MLHLKIKQIESLLKINYIATLSNLFFNRVQTRKCPILQGGKTLLTRKPITCNEVGGVLPISGHNLIPKGYVAIKKLIFFSITCMPSSFYFDNKGDLLHNLWGFCANHIIYPIVLSNSIQHISFIP